MASYDYKEGKKRVEAILDNELEIIEQDKLPAIDKLTFDNAYKSWVSAIFVDIRDLQKKIRRKFQKLLEASLQKLLKF